MNANRVRQLRTLSQREKEVAKIQPEILDLRKMLLKLGGEELVVMPLPRFDPLVLALVRTGVLMDLPIDLREMQRSNCHANVEALWGRRKDGGLSGIATGYALSEDGLWRWHSWGVAPGPLRIIETTESRLKYFGVTAKGKEGTGVARSWDKLLRKRVS